MALSVGFIGLGNRGNPMAANVLKNAFPMTVFDKNPRTMENLVQAGAKAAASAQQVVESAEGFSLIERLAAVAPARDG